MRRLAVFDLDGTLTDTNDVDAECFLAALEASFSIRNASHDWEDYSDVTDVSILAELVMQERGRPPSHEEQTAFIGEFVRRLAAEDRKRFTEIAGARTLLTHLQAIGWTVVVATGGWRESALLKLRYGGFGTLELPVATGNDARTRVEIIGSALMRGGGALEPTAPIVLFGDAIWDVRAAQRLGLPLIAVAAGACAAKLGELGARVVIENYLDIHRVIGAIDAVMRDHLV